MAIQVVCDNCGHILRNESDSTDAEPEAHATLKLHVAQGNQSAYPIDMDLCLRCAKKYLKVLRDPI